MQAYIDPRRQVGRRDTMIYGHFLEHFHRQIYEGIYEPGSPLSNRLGLRKDVITALQEIEVPVVRWPGGCFVSSYHWKDGVGNNRVPVFDKAWRVEEPNTFGTDEFIMFCREIGAEPYICTNAGTGSPEEMSDWVEYCNLKDQGKWARKRIENGHEEPFNVKYWSIGNENWGAHEIGAKTSAEWSRYVAEAAKMMKRVDPYIELFAASVVDIDWNINLLKEAGQYLDWISIHGYWDKVWTNNDLASYEKSMIYTTAIEEPILKTKYILGALGYLGKIKIAYDEWNMRGWYHPYIHQNTVKATAEECAKPRDDNDINSSYTMADAVFSACFLNQCLKHSDIVGMANFSPTVNTRGAVYTHKEGIVLRPTYFVFKLYTKYMGEAIVDSWIPHNRFFDVEDQGQLTAVPTIDIVPTLDKNDKSLRVAIVNKHPDKATCLELDINGYQDPASITMHGISGISKDAYNDIETPSAIEIESRKINIPGSGKLVVEMPPHSVNVLVLDR
ncbi:MAG: alpha-N-arabinofuranosidase [Firmicutes bacterium]|nr:alpha-N-arabinofuranosidase [Bacillota bacterium]